MDNQNNQIQTQSRWKSAVLWGAIFAQVISLLLVFDVIDTGLGVAIEQAIAAILELLTLFGVLNNPTNKTGF